MASILVVDDEKGMRVSISKILTREGYDVLTAENADSALSALKNNKIDVVVSDILMPKTSGVDLLKSIKNSYPDIQVILITGEPTTDTAAQAVRAGAVDYISKPVSIARLKEAVSSALRVKFLKDENSLYMEHLEKLVELRTQTLRESERKYREISERSTTGIVIVQDQRIVFANPKFYEIVGYEKENYKQIIGVDIRHFVFCNAQNLTEHELKFLNQGMVSEKQVETQLKTQNGEDVWVEMLFNAIEHQGKIAIMCHIINISKRKAAQEKLLESEENFRSLAENSMDYISRHDKDCKLIYANKSFIEANDCAVRGVIGKSYSDLGVDPKIVANIEQRIRQVFVDSKEGREIIELEVDGKKKYCDLRMLPEFDKDGQVKSVLGVSRDITDIMNAEEEKEGLETQFQQAQKMESVGRLAGGIAHDFNNLLTGIIGNLSLALMDIEKNTPLAELLNEINEASSRAMNLTKQLLVFSRKQKIERKAVNVNALILGFNKMLKSLIGEDITVKVLPDRNIGQIKVDASQIEQVIINLAINARDAMPDGGNLTISTEKIKLDEKSCRAKGLQNPGSYILIKVKDSGYGMSESVRSKIFEPFFTTKSKEKGTGLGLSMVYGVVQHNDGFIEVESQLGSGTTFKLYFAEIKAEPLDVAKTKNNEKMPSGSETILLVEDEPLVLEFTKRSLKRLGYNIYFASCADEALSLISDEDLNPDLLLTDVVMPGMNGRELAEEVRRLIPGVKVIFSSGYSADIIAKYEISGEEMSFLQKPFTPQTLANKVRNVLDAE